MRHIPLHRVRVRDLAAYEAALNYVEQHPAPEEDEEDIVLARDERGVYWLDKGHRQFIRTQLGQNPKLFGSCVTDDPVVRFVHEEKQHGTARTNSLRRHDARGTRRPDGRRDRRDRGAVDGRGTQGVGGRPYQYGQTSGRVLARVGTYVDVLRKSFEKDTVKKVSSKLVADVFARQRELALNPHENDGPVKGLPHAFKARVGVYRILFFIHEPIRTVDFFRVRHRREVYKNLPRYSLPRTSSHRSHDAGPQERELERLLQAILKGTRYEGKVFAVGGYVRDELLGKEPADLDVVVEMPYGAQRVAGYLRELFPSVVVEPLALDYPIWHASFPEAVEHAGETYDIAGAELDLTDTQTKLQAGYTEFGPISEDVKRRDFTVNMLLKDLSSGEILDPTGVGREDISKGVLHAIPDADKILALRDQPRQMLRLIRFMVQYGWHPDEEEEAALRESVRYLATISGHGLKKEFHKLKQRGLLNAALKLMRGFGMLEPLKEAWRKAKADDKV